MREKSKYTIPVAFCPVMAHCMYKSSNAYIYILYTASYYTLSLPISSSTLHGGGYIPHNLHNCTKNTNILYPVLLYA